MGSGIVLLREKKNHKEKKKKRHNLERRRPSSHCQRAGSGPLTVARPRSRPAAVRGADTRCRARHRTATTPVASRVV